MSLKDNFSQALNDILKKDVLAGTDGSRKSSGKNDINSYIGEQSLKAAPHSEESFSSQVNIDFDPDLPDDDALMRARQEMSAHSTEEDAEDDIGGGVTFVEAPKIAVTPVQPAAPASDSAPAAEAEEEYCEDEPDSIEDDEEYYEETAVAEMNPGLSFFGGQLGSGEEVTVITKNTVIDGSIRSFTNLIIEGTVNGDVQATKNAEVCGKITGNIVCNSINLSGAEVHGNISAKGSALMDKNTIMVGDLSAQYADVNGKIKGNLEVSGKVEFHSDAVVLGDINAHTISILDGANVQGYVHSTFLSDNTQVLFPESAE